MVQLDISKSIPGKEGQPRAIFREDPDLKRSKNMAFMLTIASMVIILVAVGIFGLLNKNWNSEEAKASDEVTTVQTAAKKYKQFEAQAAVAQKLSQSVDEIISSKTVWTDFLLELSANTPKNVVYTSFSAGDQSIIALAESVLGFPSGSLTSDTQNLISKTGSDEFIRITKVKVDKYIASWSSMDESKKASALLSELKGSKIWDNDNTKAINEIDAKLKIKTGKFKDFIQGKVDIGEIIAEMRDKAQLENKIRIEGQTSNYTTLAQLIDTLAKMNGVGSAELSSANLRVMETGRVVIDFSVNLNMIGDLRFKKAVAAPEETIEEGTSADSTVIMENESEPFIPETTEPNPESILEKEVQ